MDKTCYAVLWIPTFTHKSFIEHPIKETIRRNISDLVNEELEIIATLRKDKSIGISALGEKGKKKGFLRLEYSDCSRNGLIEYSYKETHFSDMKSDGFQFTSEIFPEAIYHIIKEFYHEHEYHDHEADTSLPPYTSNERVDLQQNDNPALQHYLERYETALNDLVIFARRAKEDIAEDSRKKKLKERIVSLRSNVKTIWEEAKKEKEFKKRIASCWSTGKNKCVSARKKKLLHYHSLGKIITKAKGYEIYLNALYGSIYNTKCKICACNNCESTQSDPSRNRTVIPQKKIQRPTPAVPSETPTADPKEIQEPTLAVPNVITNTDKKENQEQTPAAPSEILSVIPNEIKKEDPQKDMRRRAFNIESLIKYFNACYQQYNQQNIIEQIKNDRRATKLAMWGIFITLFFGLFNPLSFFKDSSTEPQNEETQIIEDVNENIDSLNAKIKDLTKAMSAQTDNSTNYPPDNAALHEPL